MVDKGVRVLMRLRVRVGMALVVLKLDIIPVIVKERRRSEVKEVEAVLEPNSV